MTECSETQAYRLASEIEWITAGRIVAAFNRQQGRPRCNRADFYDAHAATELGQLIFNRMKATP